MTADQVKGKSMRWALRYNLQKVEQGVATVLDHSFVAVTEQAVMKEVAMVRMQKPNLQKYFYHTSLNFPPTEDLPDAKMVVIAKEYLGAMGFDQHQYAIFRHFDADHPHMHILVNRIGYDGTVVSDSKDYRRSEQVLRKLEKQHGLTEVISSGQAQERAMTKNELEMMKRTDEPSVKMKLQVIIKSALNQKPDAENFIKLLNAQGINVLFNQASTGFVSGISYGYGNMIFKGAHLGNAYKWQAVKNAIGYEQERDRATIHQANLRTRALQSASAGHGARTVVRIGADKDTTDRNRKAVYQSAGQLQDQIRAANTDHIPKIGDAGNQSYADSLPNDKHGKQRGAILQGGQRDWQQVADQALPGSGFIRGLLGPDHDADHMDQNALNELKRKKRKKRKLRL